MLKFTLVLNKWYFSSLLYFFPFISKYPYEVRDKEFYEKQLDKVFIYFVCKDYHYYYKDPSTANFPNESEFNLYPRVLDKGILDDKYPPSQIFAHDALFHDFENEERITHEI